jgi:hypothetical protein
VLEVPDLPPRVDLVTGFPRRCVGLAPASVVIENYGKPARREHFGEIIDEMLGSASPAMRHDNARRLLCVAGGWIEATPESDAFRIELDHVGHSSSLDS